MSNAEAVFVMPHYSDHPSAERYLEWTLAGLYAQTDPDWRLVIVDDASPDPRDRLRLRDRVRAMGDKAVLLQQEHNRGQGICRNVGVVWAAARGAPFVLFNDADDVSHPRRLEVTRRVFQREPDIGFVYSTFVVVDEDSRPLPREKLTSSIVEILDSHCSPVEGHDGWIRIGTETGYTTLTSTVAVRTDIAVNHPFPSRGSEDAHTWLRMSAATAMRYRAEIPSQYRIPQHRIGSADRTRMGAEFYRRKAELDLEGFVTAAATAVTRGSVDAADVPALRARFVERLAETLEGEAQYDLAQRLRNPVDVA